MTSTNNGKYVIDQSELGTSKELVPKDVPSSESADSYDAGNRKEKHEILIHVFNELDTNADITPAFSSYDDSSLSKYDTGDTTKTVSSGGNVPGSVETFRVQPSFEFHGVELTPAADPTSGQITVVIEHKTHAS